MNLVKAALCAALYPNVVKVVIPPDKGRGQKKRLRKEDIHFHVRREPDEDSDSDDELTKAEKAGKADMTPEGQIKAVCCHIFYRNCNVVS